MFGAKKLSILWADPLASTWILPGAVFIESSMATLMVTCCSRAMPKFSLSVMLAASVIMDERVLITNVCPLSEWGRITPLWLVMASSCVESIGAFGSQLRLSAVMLTRVMSPVSHSAAVGFQTGKYGVAPCKCREKMQTFDSPSGLITTIACMLSVGKRVKNLGTSLTVTSFTWHCSGQIRWSRCGMWIVWWNTRWYIWPLLGWSSARTPLTVSKVYEPCCGSYPTTSTDRL